MSATSSGRRRVIGYVLLAVAIIVSLAGAVALWRMAGTQEADVAATEVQLAELNVLEVRASFELAALAEANAKGLHGVGVGRSNAITRLERARLDATGDLRAVLEAEQHFDENLTAVARRLLVGFGDVVPSASDDPDSSWLFDAASFVVEEGDLSTASDATRALDQISALPVVPQLVLWEAVVADVVVNPREVLPVVEEQVRFLSGPLAEGNGGWLDESGEPYAGLFDLEEARETFPAEIAEGASILRRTGVVTIDEWLSYLDANPVQPPYELTEIADRIDAAATSLEDVFWQALGTERSELDAVRERADSSQARFRWMSIGLTVLGALLLMAVIGLAARLFRRGQAVAALAHIDPLTGVGNRRLLDDRTAALTSDERFSTHCVALLDLDHFKLINDSYGHRAGDEILIAVASRLTAAADELAGLIPGSESTVVRLGGDEFLLSLHTPEPFDVDFLSRCLRAISQPPVVLCDPDGATHSIAPEFSLGVVRVEGPAPLADLVTNADLRVYNDKSERKRQLERPSTRPMTTFELRMSSRSDQQL